MLRVNGGFGYLAVGRRLGRPGPGRLSGSGS